MSEGYHIEDEVHQRSYDTQLMKRLLGYVRPYKWLLVTATILGLGESTFKMDPSEESSREACDFGPCCPVALRCLLNSGFIIIP